MDTDGAMCAVDKPYETKTINDVLLRSKLGEPFHTRVDSAKSRTQKMQSYKSLQP